MNKKYLIISMCLTLACLGLKGQMLVESESYSTSQGVQLENCADIGGGLNVGYIDTNDWMEYDLNIPMTGDYQLSFRVASLSGGGVLSLSDENGTLGDPISIPATGDWQNWSTVQSSTVLLNSGAIKVRMKAISGGFNFNWFQVRLVNPVDTDAPTAPIIQQSQSDVHSISISWNASTDPTSVVVGYTLYDDGQLLANTEETSFTLTKLSPEKEFSISLYANDLAGNQSEPATLSISTTAIDWPLIWADEFDGTDVNTDNWNFQTGGGGWGNDEVQYYTNGANSSVSNGLLTIEVKQETIGSNDYTSSRMNTSGKFDFKYGRIEVRATLPSTNGTWPAIWTLPTNWIYGDWPNSGEIDIMEHSATYGYGHVFGTIHTEAYNHTNGTQQGGGVTFEDVTNTFHTYALEWYPDHLDWYFDDELVFTFANEYKTSAEWPFDDEHHLLLNVAVGGSLGGNINHNGNWPQQMQVDFVRYYEIDLGQDDDVAPSAPTNLQAEVSGIIIDLAWDKAIDNYYVEKYNLYLDDDLISTTKSVSQSIVVPQQLTEYDISVEAIDFGGNTSEKASITITSGEATGFPIPGKFEAEDYLYMSGMQAEDCSDLGGGENMGFINSGDWLEYSIDVVETGTYFLSARTAAESSTGSFELLDETGSRLTIVQTPATGGWQNWETVSSDGFQLNAGVQRIKINSLSSGFNLNWFEIKESIPLGSADNRVMEYEVYPNPSLRYINVANAPHDEFVIMSINGVQVLSGPIPEERTIDLQGLKAGMYILVLVDKQTGMVSRHKFLKEVEGMRK